MQDADNVTENTKYLLEGSRRPQNPKTRRFFGSVTRRSPKTPKIKTTFFENVDGQTSRNG